MLFDRFYVRVGILLKCRNHLHDHIISLKGEVWTHKTNLTSPLFIEVPVPSQECERSCICVLRVSILPRSTIFLLDFGNVPRLWYFFYFISLERHNFVPPLKRSEWSDGKSLGSNNSKLCAYIQQWHIPHQWSRPSIFWLQTSHIFPSISIIWWFRTSIFLATNKQYFSKHFYNLMV